MLANIVVYEFPFSPAEYYSRKRFEYKNVAKLKLHLSRTCRELMTFFQCTIAMKNRQNNGFNGF